MEINAFDSLYTPYARLAQANAQLLRKLPTAPVFIPVTWPSVQDNLADSESVQQPDAPANAYASVMLEMMSNWMRFWNELGQGMLSVLAQAQDAALSSPQREATEAIKQANGRGTARHARTMS